MRVLFPEPLGPIIAMKVGAFTVKETLCNARSPLGYLTARLFASMSDP
jgi:hypothetical protein